jgi:hypothetical protein
MTQQDLAQIPYDNTVILRRQIHVLIFFDDRNGPLDSLPFEKRPSAWIAKDITHNVCASGPTIEKAKEAFKALFMKNVELTIKRKNAITALAPRSDSYRDWPADESSYRFHFAIAQWEQYAQTT